MSAKAKANQQAVETAFDKEAFDRWFDERFEQKMQAREAARTPRLALIATKGTLDMAYPPFILASTAAALGWEAGSPSGERSSPGEPTPRRVSGRRAGPPQADARDRG